MRSLVVPSQFFEGPNMKIFHEYEIICGKIMQTLVVRRRVRRRQDPMDHRQVEEGLALDGREQWG